MYALVSGPVLAFIFYLRKIGKLLTEKNRIYLLI
jgi:hypothetical protein